jgi:acetyl-CoA carboxylase biotin carboxyl carrier protein
MNAPADESREEEPMTESGLVEGRATADPVAVGPGGAVDDAAGARNIEDGGGNGAAGGPVPAPALAAADASLLALVDRLTAVLERSDLGELEVAAGGTTIVLRAPSAVERPAPVAVAAAATDAIAGTPIDGSPRPGAAAVPAPQAPAKPAVNAPLTGIFYGAPSPGATPYVAVGDHVSVGQIIGLIEAMKLFNEIKSDLAGRVTRVCVDTGALVKAKQALIEVEPA